VLGIDGTTVGRENHAHMG